MKRYPKDFDNSIKGVALYTFERWKYCSGLTEKTSGDLQQVHRVEAAVLADILEIITRHRVTTYPLLVRDMVNEIK